jgi:hypothetical protein
MDMKRILTTLFTRKDAKRDQIVATAAAQSAVVVSASKRLQDTIGELMDRNDHLTFRGVLKNAKGVSKE